MSARHISSRPDRWTLPRPTPMLHTRGPVLPMVQPRTAYHRLGLAWKACIWGAGLAFAAVLVPNVLGVVL